MKNNIASQTELINSAHLIWIRNPIPDLLKKELIKRSVRKGEIKTVTYYELTEKGNLLHKKMSEFYTKYDKLLKQLNSKLKITIRSF